ncbi:uncharacterized protein [Antedon mediterranea]|uniref:uncharacterized protein n=1 Tax=Antedon mediterranea TaxID=105859 RepID=UPI003AF931E8
MTSMVVVSLMLMFIQALKLGYGSDMHTLEPGSGMYLIDEVCSNHESCQNECGSLKKRGLCHCDSNCELYGDCCYDYWKSCQNNNLPNVTPSLLDSTICLDDQSSDNFLVISKCSPETVDKDLLSNCEKPDLDDLLFTIPVSDKHNLTYLNVFCALCNGVSISNVMAWQITANCRNKIKTSFSHVNPSTHSILSQIDDTECTYEYNPTGGSYKRRCSSGIKHCPPYFPEQNTANLCKSYAAAVYVNSHKYANPHCARCHDETDYMCLVDKKGPRQKVDMSDDSGHLTSISIDYMMEDSIMEEPVPAFSPDIIISGRIVPISILIDFSSGDLSVETPTKRTTTKGIDCGSGRVFNPFKEVCINTFCEQGKVLTENGCIYRMAPLKDVPIATTPEQLSELFCMCSSPNIVEVRYRVVNESTISSLLLQMTSLVKKYNTSMVDIHYLGTLDVVFVIKTSACNLLGEVIITIHQNTEELLLENLTMIQTCSSNGTLPVDRGCITKGLDVNTIDILYQTESIEVTDGLDNFTITDYSYRIKMKFNMKNKTTIGRVEITDCITQTPHPPSCPVVALSINEFHITENNTWIYIETGDKFSYDELIQVSNDTVFVCSFLFQNGTALTTTVIFIYEETLQIINLVGVSLSLCCLFLTCALSCIGKSLRTNSSKIVLNISISLFLAQFGTLFAGTFVQCHLICTIVACLLHYLWLVSFMCMFVMSLSLFKSFHSFKSSIKFRKRKQPITMHLLCCWIIPLVFVLILVITHFFDGVPIQFSYGDDTVCWIRDEFAALILFGIPSGTIFAVNALLFVVIVHGIEKSKKKSRKIRKSSKLRDGISNVNIYAKICCIMGLTWIVGCLTAFFDHPVLWYIFVILNSLQGVFIFISFSLVKMTTLLNQKYGQTTSPIRTVCTQQKSCNL